MLELPVLIYDGDCAFCSTSVRFLKRINSFGPTMTPYQWVELEKIGLSKEDCKIAVQYVTQSRQIFSAEKAFSRYFIDSNYPWKIFGYILRMPLVSTLAHSIYKFVAVNRYRLPGGTPTCGL